mmetsp:Transcript_29818/g.79294  ORF Transcript_29818/g.79294 Transcript_29818/m.79294 type:complete len:247 (+) Transcript_29818:646-1386(+)
MRTLLPFSNSSAVMMRTRPTPGCFCAARATIIAEMLLITTADPYLNMASFCSVPSSFFRACCNFALVLDTADDMFKRYSTIATSAMYAGQKIATNDRTLMDTMDLQSLLDVIDLWETVCINAVMPSSRNSCEDSDTDCQAASLIPPRSSRLPASDAFPKMIFNFVNNVLTNSLIPVLCPLENRPPTSRGMQNSIEAFRESRLFIEFADPCQPEASLTVAPSDTRVVHVTEATSPQNSSKIAATCAS